MRSAGVRLLKQMSFEQPRLEEWLHGQCLFVTGATGFIGKVLLEKLLRVCPTIDTVYVLMRSKKGKTLEERLQEMLSSPMFNQLKSKHPEAVTKFKVFEGDVSAPKLGMKEADIKVLQDRVHIIIHAAASVRFDDALQQAIFTNTRSTRDVINMAKHARHLKAFVHVSTAYTNCDYKHIKEEIYPINVSSEKMIRAAEQLTEVEMSMLESKVLGPYPNTYIFTKNLAEQIVWNSKDELPIVIYRPAVVNSAVSEPEPGWMDNLNSVMAIVAAASKGVMRVGYDSEGNYLNAISVDVCCNGIIAAAYYRDVYMRSRNLPSGSNLVFNATDFDVHMADVRKFGYSIEYEYPMSGMLWKGYYFTIQNVWLFHLLTILLHVIPGMLFDVLLKLRGHKPILQRIYRKIYNTSVSLKHFSFNNWTLDTENFTNLEHCLHPDDRPVLYLNTLDKATIHEYYLRSYKGLRKMFGDPPEPTKADIAHACRLYWIDMACRFLFIGTILWWVLPIRAVF